jgi:5'(3')-deoxyribonucleotidase
MPKIFVDLDGVLTDFIKQLCALLDKPLDRKWEFTNDPKIWKKIDEAGESFWTDMEWMPGGHELWNAVKKYNPTILTSPSRHESSKKGKRVWMKDNIPEIPYIIDEDKAKYAKKGYILIDDLAKNIDKWEKAGGTGILHKDAGSTIKKLKNILGEKEASMYSIIARLDNVANKLESLGMIKEAYFIDKVADAMEKEAGLDLFFSQLIDSIMKKRPSSQQVVNYFRKGIEKLWPIPPNVNKSVAIANAWKKALNMLPSSTSALETKLKTYKFTKAKYPSDPKKLKEWFVLQIGKALGLNVKDLEEYTMPIEEWAQLAGVSPSEFVAFMRSPDSASDIESPDSNNTNPAIINKSSPVI